MMYTYFPHAFLVRRYCSLIFMFVHNIFKSVRTRVFTPQITERKRSENVCVSFVSVVSTSKIIQVLTACLKM